MSNSSKFVETQGQVDQSNSRNSLNITISNQQTPISDNNSQSEDQLDHKKLLELEVKQLKRQNQFLKKKIVELNQVIKGDKPQKKKIVKKGAFKQDKSPVHLSIEFFFQQINNLLSSVAQLFKIQIKPSQVQLATQSYPQSQNINPLRKYVTIKKFALKRQLEKVILLEEDKKYPTLLQIFKMYYKSKQQCDIYVKDLIDSFSNKALEFNKILLERAQNRRSLKGSAVRSHLNINETFCQNEEESSIHIIGSASQFGQQNPSKNKILHKRNVV